MKDKLIVLGHIVVIIIIYILSFLLPGTVTNFFDFPKQIDFVRIIIQSLLAIAVFVFGAKMYVEKIMKLKLSSLRVKIKKPDTFWIFIALIVPTLVVLFYYITDKATIIQDNSDSYNTIRFFYSYNFCWWFMRWNRGRDFF